MIDNKFLHYKTLNGFKTALTAGNIDDKSIAFIQDVGLIWTHDTYYGGGIRHIILTQQQYNDLEEYEPDVIYLIVAESPVADTWQFGDVFPIILQ